MAKLLYKPILFLLLLATPVLAQSPADTPPQIHIQADDQGYNMESQEFSTTGNVLCTYKDLILTADTVKGNALTGEVEAIGNVHYKSADREFTSNGLKYNINTQIGNAQDASANVNGIYFHANEMESKPDKYVVNRSRFTTCDRENPHYYLSAKELIVQPGKQVVAKHAALYLLGKRIISLPKYTTHIGDSGRRKTKLPSVGLNDRYGAFIGYEFDISHEPNMIGGLDLRLSASHGIQGGLLLDQVANRPIYIRATHRQPYYSGGRDDLFLTRFPEIGIRYCSGPTAKHHEFSRTYADLSGSTINPLRPIVDGKKLNVVTELSAGKFKEFPTQVSTEREDARILTWLDAIPIGSNTVFSPGVSARFSRYGDGNSYQAYSLRLAAARKIGHDTYFSMAYITNSVKGETPFEFDRVELRDELTGKVRFSSGTMSFEVGGRYDIRNSEWFDTVITVGNRYHCLEPSITWRSRFREFSFNLGLVGF